MLKEKKATILIVEMSDIIRKGLTVLLTEKNDTPLSIKQCDGNCDLQRHFIQSPPHIIIASPAVFERNEKQIKSLKANNNLLTIGLIYTYQHPDNLRDFDALIYVNDKPEEIQSTVRELLQTYSGSNDSAPNEQLTTREKEILKLIVSGYTTKKIADSLCISSHTVNAHRKNIMRKLDIKTVSGLTIYAVLNNIISLNNA